jgi:hypothetical protein
MTCLVPNDGRRVLLVTCTDTREGSWGRPVGACVRFFFSRSVWRYLHEASLYIRLVGGLFTKKWVERFADDSYDWLKKRFKKIKKGHKRRLRRE